MDKYEVALYWKILKYFLEEPHRWLSTADIEKVSSIADQQQNWEDDIIWFQPELPLQF